MQAVKRQFDPYPGDPPAETGSASSWEELMHIPWVQRRTAEHNFGGWTFHGIANEKHIRTHRYLRHQLRPCDLQAILGERGGLVLDYLHFESLDEYESFLPTIPADSRE